MTSLLKGHAVKIRLGSINVTSNLGSIRRSARAPLAPAKPPPITTTRAADCARAGRAKAEATDAVMPPTTFLRVIRGGVCMGSVPLRGGGRKAATPGSSEGYVLIPQRH